jgi:very-short-patch-repair endonuclease
MAAVLACGDGALLGGRAAGYLLGILKGKPPPPEVVTRGRREVPGVMTRRCKHRDRTVWRGIPVTSPARTLVDLAAELGEEDLARACHEAGVRHHTRPAQVETILGRRPNSPGASRLRAAMRGDAQVTLSKLESRFLCLLKEGRLALPETNRPAGTVRVDFRWPMHRLTVELDGFQYHNSRHSWERDRRREREAYARGDDFRRYTYADVFDHPRTMLAELQTLLTYS